MTLDAAIFDLDGLLLDTESYSERAFLETASAYQLGDLTPVFHSLIGTNEAFHVKQLSDALADRIDPLKFRAEWADRFHQLMDEEPVPLLPGVTETLNWLLSANIKCAVATSSTTPHGHEKLDKAGIREFFATVTCGDQVPRSKPHPDIFLKAGASINANMSRSIGLEDSANGVRAAHAAGLHVIQVPNIVKPSAELMALGHTVCDNMFDALKLLQNGFPKDTSQQEKVAQ